MGQKVNPHGLRVGVIADWNTTWYADKKEFSKFLKEDNVIRPTILWNDGRTYEECDYLNNVIGKDKLSEYTANISFTGFTAPKILWVKNKEPENFAKIAKIILRR